MNPGLLRRYTEQAEIFYQQSIFQDSSTQLKRALHEKQQVRFQPLLGSRCVISVARAYETPHKHLRMEVCHNLHVLPVLQISKQACNSAALSRALSGLYVLSPLLTTQVCSIALCSRSSNNKFCCHMLSWSERHNSNPAHFDKFPFLIIAHSLHVVVSRQPEVPERPLSDDNQESCEQISRACKGSLHLPCPWKTACRGSLANKPSYKYTALQQSGRHAKAFRDAQPYTASSTMQVLDA